MPSVGEVGYVRIGIYGGWGMRLPRRRRPVWVAKTLSRLKSLILWDLSLDQSGVLAVISVLQHHLSSHIFTARLVELPANRKERMFFPCAFFSYSSSGGKTTWALRA